MAEAAILFDVVAVRPGPNGTQVRALICGPYDETDARYHAKRLKSDTIAQWEQANPGIVKEYDSSAPDQDYVVVKHHVCRQCRASTRKLKRVLRHTCSEYYEKAKAV